MSAKELERQLKKYIPKYHKGYNIYPEIKDKMHNAIRNNKKIFNIDYTKIDWQQWLSDKSNPSTNFYQIIDKIQKMHEEN